ncbi:transglutaminase family protein [Tropicimonas sediminicola]|uniref:Transglutaminase-like enzyme, putative cysteine protease n=1 Tax=Tropicimonas sediminicola TaxID=1031541 RepID=A0A239CJM8_9RHOB|nr:transglutaminase family protein [Tropicimonas sediminicola]SNS19901.1 Transglutaminase-like enzyme, putative cysteine protease [Tropicimonas sediminicola]
MRLTIQHRTTYTYSEPVPFALQQLRLTPKQGIGQNVVTWQTQVSGGKKELEFVDHNANDVMLMSFGGEGHEIVVTSQGEVETSDTNGVVGRHSGYAPLWYFQRQTPLTKQGMAIRSLVKGLSGDYDDDIARCHALSARVLEAVKYETGTTTTTTTAEEVLHAGSGVCQDHAHVFIAAARQLGFPARYVSGYLLLNDQVSQEASHAWAEVHIDALGWVGFDVPNEVCPDERYVRVATGLDYSEAAPISGLHTGQAGSETLGVDIQVQQ